MRAEKLSKLKKRKYTKRGISIDIQEISLEGDLLKIIATAKRGNKEIAVNNPLFYKNPPTTVYNGGVLVDDPDLTLKEIVLQTIEMQEE